MTQKMEIKLIKQRSTEQDPNDTQWTHVQHYIIQQRKQKRLSTDKNQIGLRVQKINIRVHNQQATGCCLGASLLRNEVVVRELNEVATSELLIICRTCRSRAKGCHQKGEKRQKRKKARVSTKGTYLRDKTGCARRWAV